MLRGWEFYKKADFWQKVEAIASLFIVVVAGFALYYSFDASNKANDIANRSITNEQQANNLTEISVLQAQLSNLQSQLANNLTQQANIIAQGQANLTQQALQLQNTEFNLQNFNTSIIPYPLTANIYGSFSDFTTSQNTSKTFDASGATNVNFMIFTPHAGKIHLTLPNFTYSLVLPNASNNTSFFMPDPAGIYNLVFLVDNYTVSIGGQGSNYVASYDGLVQTEASQVNFTIPISANITIGAGYLMGIKGLPWDNNPNAPVIIQNTTVPIKLGTINFNGDFFDGVTQKDTPIPCSVDLVVYINWFYREA